MKVLGISGSLRRDSYNSALLRAAAERLPAGVELVEFEGLAEIPPYDADVGSDGETPAAVAELREAVREADAVLIATPEYNHSIPGELKNALDWASRPGRRERPRRASRRRRSAPRPGCSARSGPRPRRARCSAPSAAAWSRRELPVARARPATGRRPSWSWTLEQSEQLEELLAASWSPPPRRPTNSPASGPRRSVAHQRCICHPTDGRCIARRQGAMRSTVATRSIPLSNEATAAMSGQLRPRHEIGLRRMSRPSSS